MNGDTVTVTVEWRSLSFVESLDDVFDLSYYLHLLETLENLWSDYPSCRGKGTKFGEGEIEKITESGY